MGTTNRSTALVVESEPTLSTVLGDYLNHVGFTTEWLANSLDVVQRLKHGFDGSADHVDIVLLDTSLSGSDGLQVMKELREISDVPVILMTARIEEIDCLTGLEAGADDYICKPFSPPEAIARIKTVLRWVDRTNGLPEARKVKNQRFRILHPTERR